LRTVETAAQSPRHPSGLIITFMTFTLPFVAVGFLLLQRYLVAGVTAGPVK
jgi:ABC-type glycerol-3-phosphate transport system permease component